MSSSLNGTADGRNGRRRKPIAQLLYDGKEDRRRNCCLENVLLNNVFDEFLIAKLRNVPQFPPSSSYDLRSFNVRSSSVSSCTCRYRRDIEKLVSYEKSSDSINSTMLTPSQRNSNGEFIILPNYVRERWKFISMCYYYEYIFILVLVIFMKCK